MDVEALLAELHERLRGDVGIDPGKTATRFRRNRKFASAVPASKSCIDLASNP
jgi:hypothetical protein